MNPLIQRLRHEVPDHRMDIGLQQQAASEIERLETELERLRSDRRAAATALEKLITAHEKQAGENVLLRDGNALIIQALNCAIQLIDSLIAWMPEGSVISPEVGERKAALDDAMARIRGGTT